MADFINVGFGNMVSAAMSISPAAPMLHSKYNVFIVVDSFMFLSFYMHFSMYNNTVFSFFRSLVFFMVIFVCLFSLM